MQILYCDIGSTSMSEMCFLIFSKISIFHICNAYDYKIGSEDSLNLKCTELMHKLFSIFKINLLQHKIDSGYNSLFYT